MANKNIQMKQKNGASWDKLYPLTLLDNVFDVDGVTSLRSLIQISELQAKTLYVSVGTGNDGNDGTAAHPFKTIAYALSTVKKLLNGHAITIRVLPGDYRAEGTIYVFDFTQSTLLITAYDGANEVKTVNTNYLVDSFNVQYNDSVTIQGFEVVPVSDVYAYGMFISNTPICTVDGCFFNKTNNLVSGWGCTGQSLVRIQNCKVTGALNVISANWGAKVICENWDAGSTNNSYVFRLNNGAAVYRYDDTLPAYNNALYLAEPTGQCFDKAGMPTTFPTANQMLVSKNIALAENIVIPLNFVRTPTWISASAGIQGTKIMSNGHYNSTNPASKESCIATNFNGDVAPAFNIINLQTGAGDNVNYTVTALSASSLTLTRAAAGAPTGTLYISLLLGF